MSHPIPAAETKRRLKALREARGNLAHAATRLGLPRSTVQSWARSEPKAAKIEYSAVAGRTSVLGPREDKLKQSREEVDGLADQVKSMQRERDLALDQLGRARGARVSAPIRVGRPNRPARGELVRVIIPDSHGDHIARNAAAAFLSDLKQLNPHEIVMLGDHLDCGGFLAQHQVMGYVAETETTYEGDVMATNEFLDQIQANAPRAQISYIGGNHECYDVNTDILTPSGWVNCREMKVSDKVLTFVPGDDSVVESSIIAAAQDADAQLVAVEGDCSDELVSLSHRVLVDDRLVPVSDLVGQRIACTRMRHAGYGDQPGMPFTDDILRLLVWVICDGCVWHKSPTSCRIQFKLSRPEKIERLKALLDRMGVPYTHGPATKSGINKLQPFMFRIYGQAAREIVAQLGGEKAFDARWEGLTTEQLHVVLQELSVTDGGRAYNHITWVSTEKESVEHIQMACVRNGVVTRMRERQNHGGLGTKLQYFLTVFDRGLDPKRKVSFSLAGRGVVIALQTTTGAMITRRSGAIAFTGNCRVEKWCVTQALRNKRDAQFLLDAFGPVAVLKLKQRGIRYIEANVRYDDLPVPGIIKLGECCFTHGTSFGTHAAHDHVKKYGVNIVFGHIHRAQASIIRTVGKGVLGGWSPGCLAQLQPYYMATNPTDWTHGYGIQIVNKSGKFLHLNIPILDGESLLFRGGSLLGKQI